MRWSLVVCMVACQSRGPVVFDLRGDPSDVDLEPMQIGDTTIGSCDDGWVWVITRWNGSVPSEEDIAAVMQPLDLAYDVTTRYRPAMSRCGGPDAYQLNTDDWAQLDGIVYDAAMSIEDAALQMAVEVSIQPSVLRGGGGTVR